MTLFDVTEKPWAALRELEQKLHITANAPDVRREIAGVRDALNRLDGALRA